MTDLEPEFLSVWGINEPIVTDFMIINHLEQMLILNKVPCSPHLEFGNEAPLLVRLDNSEKDYKYLTMNYNLSWSLAKCIFKMALEMNLL